VGGEEFSTGYAATIGSNGILANANTGLTADDEVTLRFDVVGSELSLWAWPAGQEMPSLPAVRVIDSTYEEGLVGLAFLEFPGEFNALGNARDFRANAVPEPASMTLEVVSKPSQDNH